MSTITYHKRTQDAYARAAFAAHTRGLAATVKPSALHMLAFVTLAALGMVATFATVWTFV